VQTCRGSHTHTLVLDPNDKANVYIYVSGTSFVRQPEELAGCSGEKPDKDPNTALFRIDVIKVPVAAPQDAKIVSTPRLFIDPRSGALNGLTSGGSHGKNGKEEKPADTDQCHDITVYTAIGLAAGACSGNGILLDIKDPVHPKRLDAVNDPNYSYWHSASFSNDGTKVVFTDEWGGGLGARCRPNDPNKWGADAIFRLQDDKLTFANYYKLPAAQGDTENCVAHNGSLVPVPGRDIEVQAWYQGGISIMDFTDPANPSRSPTSTVARSILRCSCSEATGRPTGTTATSTLQRSPEASTCSNSRLASFSRKTKSTPQSPCTCRTSTCRTSKKSSGPQTWS